MHGQNHIKLYSVFMVLADTTTLNAKFIIIIIINTYLLTYLLTYYLLTYLLTYYLLIYLLTYYLLT